MTKVKIEQEDSELRGIYSDSRAKEIAEDLELWEIEQIIISVVTELEWLKDDVKNLKRRIINKRKDMDFWRKVIEFKTKED